MPGCRTRRLRSKGTSQSRISRHFVPEFPSAFMAPSHRNCHCTGSSFPCPRDTAFRFEGPLQTNRYIESLAALRSLRNLPSIIRSSWFEVVQGGWFRCEKHRLSLRAAVTPNSRMRYTHRDPAELCRTDSSEPKQEAPGAIWRTVYDRASKHGQNHVSG